MIERLRRSLPTNPARASTARCEDIVFCGIGEQAGEFAGRDAVGLAAYEESERLKASGLSKGREGGDSYGRIHRIHIARINDICNSSMTWAWRGEIVSAAP